MIILLYGHINSKFDMPFKIPRKRQRDPSQDVSRRAHSSSSAVSSEHFAAKRQKPQPKKRVTLRSPTNRAIPTTVSSQASPEVRRIPSLRPEDDSSLNNREDDDALDEIVLALDLRERGTVGCCYHVAREEKLYFMDDIKFGGIDVIDTRKLSCGGEFCEVIKSRQLKCMPSLQSS